MTSNTDQKVALVTGATSPIGSVIAKRLNDDDYRLVLAVNSSSEQGSELAEQLDAVVIVADLSDPEGPESLVENALEKVGGIDALVNNAACQKLEDWLNIDSQKWDEMLDVNLRAAQLLMSAVSKHVISEHKAGVIVNISSIEAYQPSASHSHYAVSKAGLLMATKAAASELGQYGIRVNSVSPGLIDDGDLHDRWPEGVKRWLNSSPLKRLGTPEDVAEAVAFLISEQAKWITGTDLVVDGGVLTQPSW
ncbi:MAG: Glucose 1-dehydrogenase 2 [Acidimicrobiales bacterium AG-410-I20]|nr:MAG: Glucose 1-dehydrogenase 2 [Acidimicrobiales bacterium AG-410-I20]